MTKIESKKLDSIIRKVDEVHDALFKDGLVYEVRGLLDWKKSVNKVLTTVLTSAIILFLGSVIVFYAKNTK